jgi:hypothetical protein
MRPSDESGLILQHVAFMLLQGHSWDRVQAVCGEPIARAFPNASSEAVRRQAQFLARYLADAAD